MTKLNEKEQARYEESQQVEISMQRKDHRVSVVFRYPHP
jgi:hypothetical protein